MQDALRNRVAVEAPRVHFVASIQHSAFVFKLAVEGAVKTQYLAAATRVDRTLLDQCHQPVRRKILDGMLQIVPLGTEQSIR